MLSFDIIEGGLEYPNCYAFTCLEIQTPKNKIL